MTFFVSYIFGSWTFRLQKTIIINAKKMCFLPLWWIERIIVSFVFPPNKAAKIHSFTFHRQKDQAQSSVKSVPTVFLRGTIYIYITFSSFSRYVWPKRLTVIHTYIHTLMAMAAMQGADQHIRSIFLPKDPSTCRPGERTSNLPITSCWLYPWATITL